MCLANFRSGSTRTPRSLTPVPVLKKHGLDVDALSSYRPISNLSFLSKVIEKLVAKQLLAYLNGHDLLPKFQSGFRAGHSTETALTRLLSDIYAAIDSGWVTILALLDVSAAFDSVDHDILLQRLSISFGIRDRALDWIKSFVCGRTQSVVIGGKRSLWGQIHFGVPQGSVLGPLLYVLFTADIPRLISTADLGVQQYADDTQAYNLCLPVNAPVTLRHLVDTLETLREWMQSNRMKLNPDKTQYIWIGSKFQLSRIDFSHLSSLFPGLQFQQSVRNLGVTLDQHLTMSEHVGNL